MTDKFRPVNSRELLTLFKRRKRRLLYHNRNRIRCRCPLEALLKDHCNNQPQQNRIHKELRRNKLGLNSRSESEAVKLNQGLQLQLRILSLITVLLTRAVLKILQLSSPMALVELLYLNKVTSLIRNLVPVVNLSQSGDDNNRKTDGLGK